MRGFCFTKFIINMDEEMAQRIKCLLYMYEDQSSIPSTHVKKPVWWSASIIPTLEKRNGRISRTYWVGSQVPDPVSKKKKKVTVVHASKSAPERGQGLDSQLGLHSEFQAI